MDETGTTEEQNLYEALDLYLSKIRENGTIILAFTLPQFIKARPNGNNIYSLIIKVDFLDVKIPITDEILGVAALGKVGITTEYTFSDLRVEFRTTFENFTSPSNQVDE